MQRDHANEVIQMLHDVQRQGCPMNRIMDGDAINLQQHSLYNSGILPMDITELYFPDIQKMCVLHFFDLYICFDLDKKDDLFQLQCYEFETHEWPNRSIVEKFMNDMYH